MKTILLVDDEPDIRFSIKIGIEALCSEYQVSSVNDGISCFEYLDSNKKPDVILLDIMMPGMNGFQVAEKIKNNEKWKDIPIIFITAYESNDVAEKAKQIGTDIIQKPYELADLIAKINKIIGL